jgi:hypothetical protein
MSRLSAFVLIVLAFISTRATARAADALDPSTAKSDGKVLFYDIRALGIEGQGWTTTAAPFDRLPSKAEAVVTKSVWGLSHDSSGMCVRFVTDSPTLSARWSLNKANLAMTHMPATGVSGLDLYVKTSPGHWHWLAIGKPAAQTNSVTLISNIPAGEHEFILYLPLYNGVSSVEIGIPKEHKLFKAPPRPAGHEKPILFWGTSIMQGGCASRPGMCHTAILGRRFDRPVINLGFSGNGKMDPAVVDLIAELDVAAYVIDCLPNMDGKLVAERTEPLVHTLRKAHPDTPIILVEDRTYGTAFLLEGSRKHNEENRAALKKAYEALIAGGDKHLGYVRGDTMLGADGEDMVDGSHPTDLGFMRQADAMMPSLEAALGK